MKIIKLNGIEKEKDLVVKVLEESPDTIFILDSKKEIFKFLDEINLEGYAQYSLKIANEVKFPSKNVIKTKTGQKVVHKNVATLSEALQNLEEASLDDVKLVLDLDETLKPEDEKKVLSEVIQQLIYLSLDLEVLLQKEERQKMAIEIFLNQLPKLNEIVKQSILKISKIETSGITDKLKVEISQEFKKIEENLQKASNKKFSIALLAPRRTGKSMVINCFLGDEYAPTTGELITPTNCIYEVSPDNKLRVIQDKKSTEFNSIEELRNHLTKLFRDAMTKKESNYSIPEIVIQYVPKNNFLHNYTIVDTPGPNIAGALLHKEFAQKWIKEADVILYVFEYMHERDEHAINYFNEIKTYFERYDKFYSLITVDNKLDLMYDNKDYPSIVRALNMLQYYLKGLNFNSFAILGTSALQYFNSLEVLNIPDCKDLNATDSSKFKIALDNSRKIYRGQFKQMSVINFIKSQIEKLEDFHQIENPTLATLKNHSGVERLIKFTKYIATEKAGLEVFRAVMRIIDDQYSLLKNKYIIMQFKDLRSEKAMIEEAIGNIILKLDEIRKEIHATLFSTGLESELVTMLDELEDDIIRVMVDKLDYEIIKFKRIIESKSTEELKLLKKGELDNSIELDTTLAEKEFNRVIGSFAKNIKKRLSIQQNEISKKDKEIQSVIKQFQNKLKQDYDIESIDLTLPTLDPTFEQPSILFDFEIESFEFNRIAQNAIVREEGFWGWVVNSAASWLFKRNTNVKTGAYKLNEDEFNLKLETLRRQYSNELKIAVHSKNKEVKKFAKKQLADLSENLRMQSDEILNTYQNIFENILADLKLSGEEIESKIEFLKQIEEKIREFDSIWLKIRLEN